MKTAVLRSMDFVSAFQSHWTALFFRVNRVENQTRLNFESGLAGSSISF